MRNLIITADSFVDKTYYDELNKLNLSGYHVYVYKHTREELAIAHCEERFDAFINKLGLQGVPITVLPVAGTSELFYCLRSPGFRKKFEDDAKQLNFSPGNRIIPALNHQIFQPPCEIKVFSRLDTYSGSPLFVPAPVIEGNKKFLIRGFDTTEIVHDEACKRFHYTLDDKTYTGTLPKFTPLSDNAGSEGQAFPLTNGMRMKILFPTTYLDRATVSKWEAMTKLHIEHCALPKAVVYNEQEQPIGYIMEEMDGKAIPYDKLHSKTQHPLELAKSVLASVIRLKLLGVYSSDLDHNILYDDTNKTANLIDLASAQYKEAPNNAWSGGTDGFPDKYQTGLRFNSGMANSYYAGLLSVSAVLEIDGKTGGFLLNAKDYGSYMIPPGKQKELCDASKALFDAAKLQWHQEFPVEPIRWYLFLSNVLKGKTATTDFDDILPFIYELGINTASGCTYSPGHLEDVVITEEFFREDDARNRTVVYSGNTRIQDEEYTDTVVAAPAVSPTVTQKTPSEVQPAAATPAAQQQAVAPAAPTKEDKPDKCGIFARLRKRLHLLLVELIFRYFYSKLPTGTPNAADDEPEPFSAAHKEAVYRIVMQQKLWKKPLLYGVAGIAAIIALIYGASIL